MKMNRAVIIQLNAFFTSVLGRGELSDLQSGRSFSKNNIPVPIGEEAGMTTEQVWTFREEINLSSAPEIEPRSIRCPACSLVIMQTDLGSQ